MLKSELHSNADFLRQLGVDTEIAERLTLALLPATGTTPVIKKILPTNPFIQGSDTPSNNKMQDIIPPPAMVKTGLALQKEDDDDEDVSPCGCDIVSENDSVCSPTMPCFEKMPQDDMAESSIKISSSVHVECRLTPDFNIYSSLMPVSLPQMSFPSLVHSSFSILSTFQKVDVSSVSVTDEQASQVETIVQEMQTFEVETEEHKVVHLFNRVEYLCFNSSQWQHAFAVAPFVSAIVSSMQRYFSNRVILNAILRVVAVLCRYGVARSTSNLAVIRLLSANGILEVIVALLERCREYSTLSENVSWALLNMCVDVTVQKHIISMNVITQFLPFFDAHETNNTVCERVTGIIMYSLSTDANIDTVQARTIICKLQLIITKPQVSEQFVAYALAVFGALAANNSMIDMCIELKLIDTVIDIVELRLASMVIVEHALFAINRMSSQAILREALCDNAKLGTLLVHILGSDVKKRVLLTAVSALCALTARSTQNSTIYCNETVCALLAQILVKYSDTVMDKTTCLAIYNLVNKNSKCAMWFFDIGTCFQIVEVAKRCLTTVNAGVITSVCSALCALCHAYSLNRNALIQLEAHRMLSKLLRVDISESSRAAVVWAIVALCITDEDTLTDVSSYFIEQGDHMLIVVQMRATSSTDIREAGAWLLSLLCAQGDTSEVVKLLVTVARESLHDIKVLTATLFALSQLVSQQTIALVLEHEIVPVLCDVMTTIENPTLCNVACICCHVLIDHNIEIDETLFISVCSMMERYSNEKSVAMASVVYTLCGKMMLKSRLWRHSPVFTNIFGAVTCSVLSLFCSSISSDTFEIICWVLYGIISVDSFSFLSRDNAQFYTLLEHSFLRHTDVATSAIVVAMYAFFVKISKQSRVVFGTNDMCCAVVQRLRAGMTSRSLVIQLCHLVRYMCEDNVDNALLFHKFEAESPLLSVLQEGCNTQDTSVIYAAAGALMNMLYSNHDAQEKLGLMWVCELLVQSLQLDCVSSAPETLTALLWIICRLCKCDEEDMCNQKNISMLVMNDISKPIIAILSAQRRSSVTIAAMWVVRNLSSFEGGQLSLGRGGCCEVLVDILKDNVKIDNATYLVLNTLANLSFQSNNSLALERRETFKLTCLMIGRIGVTSPSAVAHCCHILRNIMKAVVDKDKAHRLRKIITDTRVLSTVIAVAMSVTKHRDITYACLKFCVAASFGDDTSEKAVLKAQGIVWLKSVFQQYNNDVLILKHGFTLLGIVSNQMNLISYDDVLELSEYASEALVEHSTSGAISGICIFIANLRGPYDHVLHKLADQHVTDNLARMLQNWLEMPHVAESISKAITALHCVGGRLADISMECDKVMQTLRLALTDSNESALTTSVSLLNEVIAGNVDHRAELVNNGVCELLLEIIGSGGKSAFTRALLLQALCRICRRENREINLLGISRLLHNNGPFLVLQEIKSIGIDSPKISEYGLDLFYMFLKQSNKMAGVCDAKSFIVLLANIMKFHIHNSCVAGRSAAVTSLFATDFANCYHIENSGILHLLVNALDLHTSSIETVTQVLTAMGSIMFTQYRLGNHSAANVFNAGDTVGTVASLLYVHSSSVQLLPSLCTTLTTFMMIFGRDCQVHLSKLCTCETMILLLKDHKDNTDVVGFCCDTVLHLCMDCDVNRKKFLECTGLPIVCELLTTHRSCDKVLLLLLRTIQQLRLTDESVKDALVDLHIELRLLDILKMHSSNKDICLEATELLFDLIAAVNVHSIENFAIVSDIFTRFSSDRNLCKSAASVLNAFIPLTCDTCMLRNEFVKSVFDATYVHIHDATVISVLCVMIKNFTTRDSVSRKLLELFINEGACDAISLVLKKYTLNANVARSLCQSVVAISVISIGKEKFASSKICEDIIKVIHVHKSFHAVCCDALTAVVDCEAKDTIVSSNVIEMILHDISSSDKCGDICSACRFIGRMLRTFSSLSVSTYSFITAIIADWMECYRDNLEVIGEVLELTGLLPVQSIEMAGDAFISRLVDLLSVHTSATRLLILGILMRFCSESGECIRLIETANVIDVVLKFIEDVSLCDEDILCGVVDLLGYYARCSSPRSLQLLAKGIIRNAQEVLENCKSDLAIESSLFMLGELCSASTECAESVAKQEDICMHIIVFFKSRYDDLPQIIGPACKTIKALSVVPSMKQLVSRNIDEELVAALRVCEETHVLAVLHCISILLFETDFSLERHIDIIEALTFCLKTHFANAAIVEAVLPVVSALMNHEVCAASSLSQQKQNHLETLHTLLSYYNDDFLLCGKVCSCLSEISFAEYWDDPEHHCILEKVAFCLGKWLLNAAFIARACEAIYTICLDSYNARVKLGAIGVANFIVYILKSHIESKELVFLGIKVISSLVRDCNRNKELCSEMDDINILVTVLHTYASCDDIFISACKLLLSIFSDTYYVRLNLDTFCLLVERLEHYSSDGSIVQDLCDLLCITHMTEEIPRVVCGTKICALLSELRCKHESNGNIVLSLICLAQHFSSSIGERCLEQLLSQKSLQSLCAVFSRNLSSSSFVLRVCNAYAYIAGAHNETYFSNLSDLAAAVVTAFRKHISDNIVVEKICQTIGSLSAKHKTCVVAFENTDICSLLSEAYELYSNDIKPVIALCKAIQHLSCSEKLSNEFISVGLGEWLIKSIENHSSTSPDVCSCACWALSAMLMADDTNATSANKIQRCLSSKVNYVTLAAAQWNKQSIPVVTSALSVLRAVAANNAGRSELHTLGAIQSIICVSIETLSNQDIARESLGLLSLLCTNPSEETDQVIARFTEAGGMCLLKECRIHQTDVKIASRLSLLWHTVLGSPDGAKYCDAATITDILEMLRDHGFSDCGVTHNALGCIFSVCSKEFTQFQDVATLSMITTCCLRHIDSLDIVNAYLHIVLTLFSLDKKWKELFTAAGLGALCGNIFDRHIMNSDCMRKCAEVFYDLCCNQDLAHCPEVDGKTYQHMLAVIQKQYAMVEVILPLSRVIAHMCNASSRNIQFYIEMGCEDVMINITKQYRNNDDVLHATLRTLLSLSTNKEFSLQDSVCNIVVSILDRLDASQLVLDLTLRLMCNLCRSPSLLSALRSLHGAGFVERILNESTDKNVIIHGVYALCSLTAGRPDTVVPKETCARVGRLINDPSDDDVFIAACECVVNICSNGDSVHRMANENIADKLLTSLKDFSTNHNDITKIVSAMCALMRMDALYAKYKSEGFLAELFSVLRSQLDDADMLFPLLQNVLTLTTYPKLDFVKVYLKDISDIAMVCVQQHKSHGALIGVAFKLLCCVFRMSSAAKIMFPLDVICREAIASLELEYDDKLCIVLDLLCTVWTDKLREELDSIGALEEITKTFSCTPISPENTYAVWEFLKKFFVNGLINQYQYQTILGYDEFLVHVIQPLKGDVSLTLLLALLGILRLVCCDHIPNIVKTIKFDIGSALYDVLARHRLESSIIHSVFALIYVLTANSDVKDVLGKAGLCEFICPALRASIDAEDDAGISVVLNAACCFVRENSGNQDAVGKFSDIYACLTEVLTGDFSVDIKTGGWWIVALLCRNKIREAASLSAWNASQFKSRGVLKLLCSNVQLSLPANISEAMCWAICCLAYDAESIMQLHRGGADVSLIRMLKVFVANELVAEAVGFGLIQMTSLDVSRETLVKHDIEQRIDDVLMNHLENTSLSRCCCDLLSVLCEQTSFQEQCSKTSLPRYVSRLLQMSDVNDCASLRACQTLCADVVANRAMFGENRACEILSERLAKAYVSDADNVLLQHMKAIRNLLLHHDNMVIFLATGGCTLLNDAISYRRRCAEVYVVMADIVTSILRVDENAFVTVKTSLIATMINAAQDIAFNQKQWTAMLRCIGSLIEIQKNADCLLADGVSALVDASVSSFEESIDVADDFPLVGRALTVIFEEHPKNVAHAINIGFCVTVVKAIKRFCSKKQDDALGYAFHMAVLLSERNVQAAELFCEEDACGLVISALKERRGNTFCLLRCLTFLNALLQCHRHIYTLVNGGIAMHITQVMESCINANDMEVGALLCRIIVNISKQSSKAQAQLGESGISRLLQQLVKSCHGEETILIAACYATRSLCVDESTGQPHWQNLSYFRLTNIEGAIYTFMGSLTCSEDLMLSITSAFEHLCHDDGISNHLGDLGICSTVVSFCKRVSNPNVMHHILLCLDVLLSSPGNKIRFIEVGGVSSLITMLPRCTSDKNLAHASLKVFMKLLRSSTRELQTNLGDICECVVLMTKQHVDSSIEVTIGCCNVFFGLANKHNENKAKLFSLGVVKLLISVSKIYESNEQVLLAAYGALRCMSFLRQVSEELVQDGFCGSLIIALKKWEQDSDVVDQMLGIASNMVSIDAEAAKLFSVKSFCDLLIAIVKAYVTKPPIAMSFFKIVAIISSDMQTSTRLGNLGTCDIALRFLADSSVCSSSLAKYGALALKNLTSAPIILILLQQTNTCEVIISLLLQYGDSEEVVEYGCQLLANIFNAHPSMIEKGPAASLHSVICSGLRSHAGIVAAVGALSALLLSLTTHDATMTALATSEMAESVVKSFCSNFSKPDVADNLMKAIGVLCKYNAAMQDIFAKLNAGDLIMKTCEGKSESEIYSIETLFQTVANMCNGHVEHTMYFCSIGFGNMAFVLLKSKHADARQCECICEVLYHLTVNPTGLRKLSKQNYAETLAKCLRTHLHEEKTLVYTCSIAVRMQKDEVIRGIFANNGMLDALNELLSTYRTSTNEVILGCIFEMMLSMLEDKKYVDMICSAPSGLIVLDIIDCNKASSKLMPIMIASLEILCSNLQIREKVGSTEGISCLTSVMLMHADIKVILQSECRILYMVAVNDRQRLQVSSAVIASLLVDACMKYQSDVGMLTDILLLVSTLCKDLTKNANQFGKAGICGIIMRLLKTHAAVIPLCKIMFCTLGTLAEDNDCINAFSKVEYCKIYLDVMQMCSTCDASVCCEACRTLSHVCAKAPDIQNAVAAAGGCERNVFVIKSHLTNKKCAEASCNALLSLVVDNESNAVSIATISTCDTLFEVIHMHSEIGPICDVIARLFSEVILRNGELIEYVLSKKIRHIIVAALNRHQENEKAVISILNLMHVVYIMIKEDVEPLPNECVLLRDWLEKFIDNNAVTSCLCRSIASMTKHIGSAYISELGDIGVCDFIARSVMTFCGISSRTYLLASLSAVYNLCQGSSANQTRLGKCNVCAFVADSFRRFTNDVDVAMACIQCFAVLARHTVDPAHQSVENIRKLEIEGACECILSSFEMYSKNLPMMIEACRAVWFFAFDEACNKKMVRLGVCTSVLQVLRMNEKEPLIAKYCMGSLANFALTDEGCSVLSTKGVVEQIVSCISTHGKDSGIMLQCGYVVANSTHKRFPVKNLYVKCNACALLLRALECHGSDVELLTLLLVALAGLCDGVPEVADNLLDADASIAIYNIASIHKSNENVCSEYLSLVLNMCRESSCAVPALSEAKIADYICHCMSTYPHNAYLVRISVRCVMKFCESDESYIDRFLECDIASILIRCVKKSFTTRDTLATLLKCLVHFMNANGSSISRMISANAPKVLCKLYLDIDLKLREVIVLLSSAIRQLCNSNEMQSLFGNVCKQATHALERYVEDTEAVLAICGALNAIVPKCPDNIKKINEFGTCKILIAAMIAQCRHQVCGQEICNLVYAISLENEDNLLSLSTKNMCTALAGYIDSYHSDFDSCSAACRSIRALVSKNDNRIVMGQTGVCSTIADALNVFSERNCASICDAIYALSFENAENAEIFGLRNTCDSLIRVLRIHSDDVTVLHPALKAMNMLCAVPSNNNKFGLQDGCLVLYDIMGRHANDPVTLRYIIRAAASMAIGNEENKLRLCDAGIAALLPKVMTAQISNVRLVEICLIALVHIVKGMRKATALTALMTTDALCDISTVLSNHLTSKSIAKHACLVLQHAVECDISLCRSIQETDLCQLVISALISHLGSSGVNMSICSSVCALAADPTIRLILGNCGGCDIVPKLLRFAVDVEDLPLVKQALVTLSALVQSSCINQEAIGRAGVCDYVVELIGADNGSEIDEKALICLAYLSRCGDSRDTLCEYNSQRLSSNGAVQSVIASLQEHSSSDDLVAAALNAVACMCCSEIIALQMGVLGAVPVIVAVAKERTYDATISRYACQSFEALSVGKNVGLLLQLDICEYLVTVLRRHLDDVALFQAVCNCILHLVKGNSKLARLQLLEEGVCGVLVGEIRRHMAHVLLVPTACKALHALCKDTLPMKAEFGSAGACETMVHVAKTYSSNYYVHEAAMCTLRELAVNCFENMERINVLGGLAVLEAGKGNKSLWQSAVEISE